MQRIRRLVCMVMIVSLLQAVPAHAEEVSPRSSSFISSYDSAITNDGDSWLTVWFDIVGKGTMDEIGVCEIKLQRSSTGTGYWVTAQTFYPEDYPDMICENTFAHAGGISYKGLSGYYYRAIVRFVSAKNGACGYIVDYAETILL